VDAILTIHLFSELPISGKRSCYNSGTILWNSLAVTIVEATTLSSFKYLYFN